MTRALMPVMSLAVERVLDNQVTSTNTKKDTKKDEK